MLAIGQLIRSAEPEQARSHLERAYGIWEKVVADFSGQSRIRCLCADAIRLRRQLCHGSTGRSALQSVAGTSTRNGLWIESVGFGLPGWSWVTRNIASVISQAASLT